VKIWNWSPGASRQEEKSVPLVALAQMGDAKWGGRDAASLVRDGYLRNAIAYRCVRLVAEAAAAVPLITAHAGVAKLLRQPMPDCAGASFLEAVYAELQLTGNAFVEAVRFGGESAPAALFPLKASAMRPVLDGRGWVEAWAVRERRGERVLRRDETGWSPVLHLKLYNPVDDVMGLPPLGPARRALDLHNASADWAKALIDNSAKPSGALIYSGAGRLSPDQFDRLKAEIEAAYAGPRNAGRPLLMEGGLEWRPMSLSPAEMDFQQSRAAAAREIALALGVPPMLLGLPGDNTYANYREANLAFWRMTVLPLAEKMAGALSLWFDEPFGGDIEVRCDLDRVPALSGERETLWARLETASFASREEKRRIAGLDT
jgi:HK97 family phage portal protein